MNFLKQSTAAQSRMIGPFVDETDGKTAETGLTIANTDIKLMANGAASANKNSGGGTHRVNGMYSVTFDATDTATVGELAVSVVVAGALPVFLRFYVLEETVFDAMFGAASAGPLTTLGTNAPAGWINAAAIASNAITDAKIASAAITNAKFATGAISSTTFATAAITADACAADFIGAAEIAASASQEIADLIAADWVSGDASPMAIAAAVWASTTRTLTSGAALDAAGIRSAVGLTSANLNTLLTTIDAVADTIQAKTDQLTFTLSGQVDANATTVDSDTIDSLAQSIITAVGLDVRSAAYTLAVDRSFLTQGEIRVKQRDDYAAADGRAFEVTITKPGVDFTSATVVGGAGQEPGEPTIVPTVSLQNKTVGSCVVRIEFTSAQLDVDPGVYFWDAHVLIGGRRNTVVDGTINVEPKYADAPA